MKTLMRIVAAAALVAAFALSAQAGNTTDAGYNRDLAETNLLVGLASDNSGLRLSAASILAEVGTERSVNPLMQMLHNGTEAERIVAAFALAKIGNDRGTFAVKRAVQFDRSEKVQRMAAWYYMEYAVPKADKVGLQEAITAVNDAVPAPYSETLDSFDDYQGGASAAGE